MMLFVPICPQRPTNGVFGLCTVNIKMSSTSPMVLGRIGSISVGRIDKGCWGRSPVRSAPRYTPNSPGCPPEAGAS